MSDNNTATLWFDPGCPFTWRTSRWLSNVNAIRGTTIDWRLMSLAILNEGNEIPEQYVEHVRRGQRTLRVLAAAAAKHGSDVLGPLYTALGTRRHVDDRPYDTDVYVEALTELDLPTDLADAADDESWDAPVRASHLEGQARVGQDSGSPVLAIGTGPGYFGPVVSEPPTGAAAERLYDAVALLATVSEFSELKRAR